eukprot:5860779-Pleurochrysis_carterae.AAC.3
MFGAVGQTVTAGYVVPRVVTENEKDTPRRRVHPMTQVYFSSNRCMMCACVLYVFAFFCGLSCAHMRAHAKLAHAHVRTFRLPARPRTLLICRAQKNVAHIEANPNCMLAVACAAATLSMCIHACAGMAWLDVS